MKLALVFAMAVGFAQWQEDGLSIGVWYPAVSSETTMVLGDYLEDRAGMEQFMSGAGASRATIDAYPNAPAHAQRDAKPEPIRAPLVLVAQGNQQSFFDQAVLCEYLASHGFIVATIPSPMIATPMQSEEEIGKFAELQASELMRVIDLVAKRHRVDTKRIGVVGHSFGARAGLLLAMQDPRVKALVSLDGGIGTPLGAESMKRTRWYRPGHVPPLLHMFQGTPDMTFLRGVGAESLHTDQIRGLQHIHFATLGYGAAANPELAKLTRGGENMDRQLAYVAERTRTFLVRRLVPD